MKTTNFFKTICVLLFSSTMFAQVGIGTTNPSKELDINGELRIRNTPDATTSGNRLLSVDASGNVQQIKGGELLVNLSNLPDVTLSSTGSNYDDYYFNATLTQDALVNISYNILFSTFMDASGGNLSDGAAKIYGVFLYYKPTGGSYQQIAWNTNPFTASSSPYMSGIYTINDSFYLFLPAGTYDFALRRRIVDTASTNGFSVLANGTNNQNRIQLVAMYN